MSDDELVDLLVWNSVGLFEYIPTCNEDCKDFGSGCANNCPKGMQERAVRKWLAEEVD